MFDRDIDGLISGRYRFKNEDWIENNLPNLHFFINGLCVGKSWKEKLFHYKNGISIPKCECGKDLEFISLSKGYRKYCSKKCQAGSQKSKNARRDTCISKYGVDNPMRSDLIKKNYTESILDKYGVDNIGKLESSKIKVRETNFKRYGVEYISQLETVKKSLSNKLKDRSYDMNKSRLEGIKSSIVDKISKFSDIQFVDIVNTSLYLMSHLDHEFQIPKTTLNDRIKNGNIICTVCNKIESGSDSEKSILDFIRLNYNKNIVENCRDIISGELDIYLPDDSIAFEYNGVFWHSDRYKDRFYHLNKTKECLSLGIKLIHIWEDDWKYKTEIIKSRILNLLGQSKRIWARNCTLKEISTKEAQDFLDKNHIQGGCVSKVRIGLFHKNILISLMTFGSLRRSLGHISKDGSYELLRFCNELNVSVVGGASKIFKYFLDRYVPKSVISYADRSWSNGGLYNRLGFSFGGETNPNYYWVVNGVRKNRFGYRKDILIREGFDPNLSEIEIMKSMGYNRIWDSGSLKFIFNL